MQGKPYLHSHVAVSAPSVIHRKSYQSQKTQRTLDKGLNAAALALLILWIVAAVLVKAGWGPGLLGVGVILLGIKTTRKVFGLRWEGFWAVLGIFSILFGIGLTFHLLPGFLPLLSLFAAAALLLAGAASRLQDETRHQG